MPSGSDPAAASSNWRSIRRDPPFKRRFSDGRLIIGLGAGWNQDESDALGIRLPPLKERFDQFEEGVQVIVKLLSEDRASFEGRHFTLTDAWCEPKPVQRPHPPIAIGGNGERRTLRIVAEHAQHWNSTLADVDAWKAKGEVLDRHCADVGRDPASIERLRERPAGRRRRPPLAAADGRQLEGRRRRRLHRVPRHPHDAAVMEPLAAALAEVG